MLLNLIRREVGRPLGLDIAEINLKAPYTDIGAGTISVGRGCVPSLIHHTTAAEFMQTFKQIYTPENLIRFVMMFLNHRISSNADVEKDIGLHIHAILRDHPDQLENFPLPYLSDELSQLLINQKDRSSDKGSPFLFTPEGVRLLLVHHGYLSPKTPNGHFVAAS